MFCDSELHQGLQQLLADSLRAVEDQFVGDSLQQAFHELKLDELTDLGTTLFGPAPGEAWKLRLVQPD